MTLHDSLFFPFKTSFDIDFKKIIFKTAWIRENADVYPLEPAKMQADSRRYLDAILVNLFQPPEFVR